MTTPALAAAATAGLALLRAAFTGLLCALVAACAHHGPAQAPVQSLLDDALFAAPAEPPDAGAVFKISPAMRDFADAFQARTGPLTEPRRALIQALYDRKQLRLAYDAESTRNAAEAFATRAGNCLSLVIMTAAFAKHLGLPVGYQQVDVEASYTRVDNITLASGHVNVVLGRPPGRTPGVVATGSSDLVVDFLPADELRGHRARTLAERTILAMYFNNRAAETLTAGHVDEAYAWARAALLQDPGFQTAANTLAVVYQRSGHLAHAEVALRHVLAASPDDAAALSNLVALLRAAGRGAEADATALRLASVQPEPPFHHADLGRRALEAGDYRQARAQFAAELRNQPENSELHFWAALAEWHLGAPDRAAEHLRLAVEHSRTQRTQQIYSAKLEWLRGVQSRTRLQ